jgi:hypothetical protein
MCRYPKPQAEPMTDADVAGRRIPAFARQTGISESMVKLEIRRGNIQVAKVGRATVILDHPAQYLGKHRPA